MKSTQLQYLPTKIKSRFTLMSAANLLPCTHPQAWYCSKVLHNFSKHMHSAFDNSHMTTMFILNCWIPLFVANVVHKLQILDAFHLSKGFYHEQCHALKKHVLCDWALGSLISLFCKWRSCVLVPSRVRTVACASTFSMKLLVCWFGRYLGH
jgi:hypothetical protein